MEEHNKEKTFFDQMPARFAFWSGVVASVAIISIVGFIVMTVLVMKDDSSTSTTTKTTTNTNTVTAPTNAAAPTTTVPSGTIDLSTVENVRGKGKLTLVEYSDLQCSYCASFHPTLQQVVKDYDGKLAWGYKHFPLTSIHPQAEEAAVASECAADQGKFWEFADYIFANQSSLQSNGIDAAADSIGLDKTKFNDCLKDNDFLATINAHAAEAQEFGGRGTPFSVLVDEDGKIVDVISGALPLASVKATIEKNL